MLVVVVERAAQAVVRKQLLDRLAPSRRFGRQQHAIRCLLKIVTQREKRIFSVPIDRQTRQRHRPAAFRRSGKLDLREGFGEGEEVVVGEKQALRFEQRTLAVVGEEVVALLRVVGETLDGRVHVADESQLRVLRQIVEQGGGFIEEKRQVILDARRWHPVANVLVDR